MAQPPAGELLAGALVAAAADGDQTRGRQRLVGVVHGLHGVIAVTGGAGRRPLGVAEPRHFAVRGLLIRLQFLLVAAAAVLLDRFGSE